MPSTIERKLHHSHLKNSFIIYQYTLSVIKKKPPNILNHSVNEIRK